MKFLKITQNCKFRATKITVRSSILQYNDKKGTKERNK